ncbi:MAG: hypothetical protein CMI02_02055 [Oceanospirillaceae bacterium]|nr:hypothetical protein [Oceanospirillaceae bacterium]MBT10804.1 hypothetical protein [Oceanospirillaceae bacterium]
MRIILDLINENNYRLLIDVSDSAGVQHQDSLSVRMVISLIKLNHGCFAPPLLLKIEGRFFIRCILPAH